MSGFEVIYTFDDGRGAAVARLDAESFEDAVSLAILRVPSRQVKRLELTDLSFEDAAVWSCSCPPTKCHELLGCPTFARIKATRSEPSR